MNIKDYQKLTKKPIKQTEGIHQRKLGKMLNGVSRQFFNPNLLFWSYSASGERKAIKTAVLQKIKGLQKGKPDYEFYLKDDSGNLRAVFLETKSGSGSLTKEQKQFFKNMENVGNAVCYTSKTIEESISILEKEKILLMA